MIKTIKKISALVAFALLMSSCSSDDTQVEQRIRPVLYQEVGYQGSNNQRTFSGTAETDKVINLSFRSSGIITQFDINLGQQVQKGQLLAKLDNVQARLGYEQAISSYNSAESQLKTAKLSYDRIRSLYEKGSASLSDFENAKNSHSTALNSLESSKRSIEIQEEQINYGFIYAPESGTIAYVGAELDENISPGQSIAVLNAGNKMTVNLGIPESVINSIVAQSAVHVEFPSLDGQVFEGKITEISPSVDRNTSTYPVQVELITPIEQVRSGMAANVTFDFGNQGNNTLVIPAKSVGEDSRGRFVFLVVEQGNQKGKVQKQHIEIGGFTSAGFEVLAGLSEGQKIATAGLQTLIDGQEVLLTN